MTAPSPTKTILFLGATGGVTNACLVHALRSSPPTTHCIALVRTPEKLRKILEPQLTPSQLSPTRLTILAGNATDTTALRRALLHNPDSPTPSSSDYDTDPTNPVLPTFIVTGLGGTPSLTLNYCHPLEIVKLDQPNICRDAATALVSALRDIYTSHPTLIGEKGQTKPRVVFVSTTGITSGPEDVPLAMRFLYHRILKEPHEDKRAMEGVFRSEAGDEGVFASATAVRPTLLTGETGKLEGGVGWGKVTAGREQEPAVGYTIARADVGEWIWEAVLRVGVEKGERGRWEGEMCSLTS